MDGWCGHGSDGSPMLKPVLMYGARVDEEVVILRNHDVVLCDSVKLVSCVATCVGQVEKRESRQTLCLTQ